MSASQTDEFQKKVSSLLVRNSNILDILTKCQISCGKLCRSTVKSATGCGCVDISGEKSLSAFSLSKDFDAKEASGMNGSLCGACKSRVENEIGEMLFYIAGMCNALGLNMNDIMQKEIKNVEVLGKYSLK